MPLSLAVRTPKTHPTDPLRPLLPLDPLRPVHLMDPPGRVERARTAYHLAPRPAGAGKTWERSPLTRAKAIPAGLAPTPTEGIWWATLRTHPALNRRAHRRAATLRVGQAIINAHRRRSRTFAVTVERLCRAARVSASTLRRILSDLVRAGLLVKIASGRKKAKTETHAWANVWAMTIPATETDCPSPARERDTSIPPRTRAKLTPAAAAQRAYARHAKDHHQDLEPKAQRLDPSLTPRATRKQLKHLARCLQHHSPDALRTLGIQRLTRLTRCWFEAGWTVGDLLHALETRPDGTRWETAGAGGMHSIPAWFCLRLRHWQTPTGTPTEAPSATRERARSAEARRRDQERSQVLSAAAERSRRSFGPSLETKRRLLILRLGEDAARHQHPEVFHD